VDRPVQEVARETARSGGLANAANERLGQRESSSSSVR
jgi:hypothetical protein